MLWKRQWLKTLFEGLWRVEKAHPYHSCRLSSTGDCCLHQNMLLVECADSLSNLEDIWAGPLNASDNLHLFSASPSNGKVETMLHVKSLGCCAQCNPEWQACINSVASSLHDHDHAELPDFLTSASPGRARKQSLFTTRSSRCSFANSAALVPPCPSKICTEGWRSLGDGASVASRIKQPQLRSSFLPVQAPQAQTRANIKRPAADSIPLPRLLAP